MPIRYNEIPSQILFLNLMKAIESFHARFICNNKNDFEKRINENFNHESKRDIFYRLLWSNDQQSKKSILLISRIYDLLIIKNGDLFYDYWHHTDFPQRLKYTRNYYTHYNEKLKERIFSGENLDKANYFLMRLIEYHICNYIGVDIIDKTRQSLNNTNMMFWAHDIRDQFMSNLPKIKKLE